MCHVLILISVQVSNHINFGHILQFALVCNLFLSTPSTQSNFSQALKQSKMSLDDVDIFELHDAFPIMACLSLEVHACMHACVCVCVCVCVLKLDTIIYNSAFVLLLSALQNVGFAKKGEGLALAASGALELTGKLPIATFGGLKARGHPVCFAPHTTDLLTLSTTCELGVSKANSKRYFFFFWFVC